MIGWSLRFALFSVLPALITTGCTSHLSAAGGSVAAPNPRDAVFGAQVGTASSFNEEGTFGLWGSNTFAATNDRFVVAGLLGYARLVPACFTGRRIGYRIGGEGGKLFARGSYFGAVGALILPLRTSFDGNIGSQYSADIWMRPSYLTNQGRKGWRVLAGVSVSRWGYQRQLGSAGQQEALEKAQKVCRIMIPVEE